MIKDAFTMLESVEIRELRSKVSGAVILPGDERYDAARQGWNLMVEQRPAVIVDVADEADVQAAVRFAATAHLPISVMSTGHGLHRACNGGVLIRMAAMTGVKIDAETGTARIQGGAQWKDVLPLAQAEGFSAMSGSAPHVGVVGYTLGGGFGLLMRKYGLAVDLVRQMRVVLASGEVVVANTQENADLFWALLGGGGTFGVVTEIEIALVREPRVFGGSAIYPADRAEETMLAYRAWTRTLPDEVTSSIVIVNFPPLPFIPEPVRGRQVVMICACAGGDLQEAERLIAPMRNLGEPILDTFGAFDYVESGRVYQDPLDPMPVVGQGVLLRDLDEEAIRDMLAAVGSIGQMPNLQIQIRHIGGAIKRVPHGATSVGCRREAEFLVYCLGVPNPMATPDAMDAHANGIFSALGQQVICRGPLNFIGEGRVSGEAIENVFHADDWARLQSVKAKFDPTNRFCYAGVGAR